MIADGLYTTVAGHHVEPHADGPSQGERPLLTLTEVAETEDGYAVLLLIDDHEPVRELRIRPLGIGQDEYVRLIELFRFLIRFAPRLHPGRKVHAPVEHVLRVRDGAQQLGLDHEVTVESHDGLEP